MYTFKRVWLIICLVAQRALTTLVDLSMTISDMMRHVGISRQQAESSAKILEQLFKQSMIDEHPEEISFTEDSAMILEGSILDKLRSKLGFSMEELRKTQKIIQVCFKDFYFREKSFTLKVRERYTRTWKKLDEYVYFLTAESFAVRPLGESSGEDARDLQEHRTEPFRSESGCNFHSVCLPWILFT